MVEPADLDAVQVEPSEHAPQPLSGLGEELDCQAMVRPLPEPLPHQDVEREEVEREVERVLEQREDVEVAAVTAASYVPQDEEAKERGPTEEEVLVCPPAESPVCEAASCPVPISAEEPERPGAVITLEEEEDEEALGGESQGGRAQKVSVPAERDTELPAIIELHSVSPGAPEPPSPAPEEAQQPQSETAPADVDLVSPPPAPASACSPGQAAPPHAAPVPCYWSLELLIAAAFCTDVPPFPLFPLSAPSAVPAHPNPHQGMELLSELADLELQQQKRTCGKTQGERLSVHAHTHTHTSTTTRISKFRPLLPSETNSSFPPPGLACVALAFLSDAPPHFLPV